MADLDSEESAVVDEIRAALLGLDYDTRAAILAAVMEDHEAGRIA